MNLIDELVALALSLTATQLDGAALERTLLDIIRKGVQAYEQQKGQPLDPKLVGSLNPL